MKSRFAVTQLAVPALIVLLATIPACSDNDTGTNPVPVTEPFDSGDLGTSGPTSIFVHRFNTAGSFSYRCKYHGSVGMTGVVDVAAAGADSIIVPMGSNFFGPPSLGSFPLKAGGYVRWVNSAGLHTVTRP